MSDEISKAYESIREEKGKLKTEKTDIQIAAEIKEKIEKIIDEYGKELSIRGAELYFIYEDLRKIIGRTKRILPQHLW